MRRREFIILVGGGATVAWPLAARAQQSKKIPRLCFLTFDPGTLQATRFAFFEGLARSGLWMGRASTSTTFPQRVVASGFQHSLPNVCVAKQILSL